MNADIKTIIELVGRQYERLVRERINVATQSVSSVRDKLAAIKSRIDAVYAHLFSRGCTQSTPTTENLLSTIQQLSTRKVDVGNKISTTDSLPEVADGECLPPLLLCTTISNRVTTLYDKTDGWAWDKQFYLSAFPNLTRLEVNCISVTKTEKFVSSASFNGDIVLAKIKDITLGRTYNGVTTFRAKRVFLPMLETANFDVSGCASITNMTTEYIYLGCRGKRTDLIYLYADLSRGTNLPLSMIELRQGARQRITIAGNHSDVDDYLSLTGANIRSGIIDKLADNNYEDDGVTVAPTITITIGSFNIAKLTAEDIAVANAKNYTLA